MQYSHSFRLRVFQMLKTLITDFDEVTQLLAEAGVDVFSPCSGFMRMIIGLCAHNERNDLDRADRRLRANGYFEVKRS